MFAVGSGGEEGGGRLECGRLGGSLANAGVLERRSHRDFAASSVDH